LPDPILAVDGDRESKVQIAHGIFNVLRFVLERKLRRVHADHDQARILIFCPSLHIGQGPQKVDAGISPEINQYHLSASDLRLKGSELSQPMAPSKSGMAPSSPSKE
jgi:hypothetical protein